MLIYSKSKRTQVEKVYRYLKPLCVKCWTYFCQFVQSVFGDRILHQQQYRLLRAAPTFCQIHRQIFETWGSELFRTRNSVNPITTNCESQQDLLVWSRRSHGQDWTKIFELFCLRISFRTQANPCSKLHHFTTIYLIFIFNIFSLPAIIGNFRCVYGPVICKDSSNFIHKTLCVGQQSPFSNS